MNEFNQLEKWVNKEVRVLFVTGLCGSGKTTLAKELALKHKAKLVSLDKYLNKLLAATHEGSEAYDYTVARYKRGVEEVLKDNPEGQLVVEGVAVLWFDPEKVKAQAVLVKNTSLMVSIWRAIKRDFTAAHCAAWGMPRPDVHIRYNLVLDKRLKQFGVSL